MLAIFVDLKIRPGQMDDFLPLMMDNARGSRSEPGCRQFDVVRDDGDLDRILLYELYDDADAFAAHQETDHYKTLNAKGGEMIADKSIRTGAVVD